MITKEQFLKAYNNHKLNRYSEWLLNIFMLDTKFNIYKIIFFSIFFIGNSIVFYQQFHNKDLMMLYLIITNSIFCLNIVLLAISLILNDIRINKVRKELGNIGLERFKILSDLYL